MADIQWRDGTVTDENMNEIDPNYRFGTRAREKATEAAGNAWEWLGNQEGTYLPDFDGNPETKGLQIAPSGQQIQQGLAGTLQIVGNVADYIDDEVFYGAGKELTKLKTKGDDALYQALDDRGIKVDRDWLGFTTGAALAGAEQGLTGRILKPPKTPFKPTANWLDAIFNSKRLQPVGPDGITTVRNGPLAINTGERMSEGYKKNRKLIKNKEGLPLPKLHGDEIINQIDDLEDATSLGEVLNIKGTDRVTRNRASGLLTGDSATAAGKGEKFFNRYTEQIARTINKFLPKEIADRIWSLEAGSRTANWHHVGPLKQVATTVNGLKAEYAKMGSDYIADGITRALGNVYGAGTPLPNDFHNRVHGFFNRLASTDGRYDISRHIETLGWGPDWQTTKTFKQRKPLYDLIVKDVIASEDAINTFWRSLNNRAELGKISRKEYLTSTLEVLELDETLAAIHSSKHASGITATDIINDILDRSNTALENSVNLVANTDTQSALYRVLLQEQSQLALIEAIYTNTSATAVFKKYKIQVKNPKVLERVIKEIDPNKLNEIMPIGDVDTHLITGWQDPRLGSSSLKTPVKLESGPLKASNMTKNEINDALRAGWTVLGDDGNPINPIDWLFP